MGLKASDFDWRDLKGTKIVDLNINSKNESTVTVQWNEGATIHTKRHRIPAAVRHLMEAYHSMESGKPSF